MRRIGVGRGNAALSLTGVGTSIRMSVEVREASFERLKWAITGAAAGGAVTAAIWFLLADPLVALLGAAIGSTLGAGLGVAIGGRANARWARDIGAAVVPAFAVAFLNGLVLLYLLTHSH